MENNKLGQAMCLSLFFVHPINFCSNKYIGYFNTVLASCQNSLINIFRCFRICERSRMWLVNARVRELVSARACRFVNVRVCELVGALSHAKKPNLHYSSYHQQQKLLKKGVIFASSSGWFGYLSRYHHIYRYRFDWN